MAEFWSIARAADEGTILTGRRDAGVRPEDHRVLCELQARDLKPHPTSPASYAAVEIWAVQRIRIFDVEAATHALYRGRLGIVLSWGSVSIDKGRS